MDNSKNYKARGSKVMYGMHLGHDLVNEESDEEEDDHQLMHQGVSPP
jgi:hypothetical protein